MSVIYDVNPPASFIGAKLRVARHIAHLFYVDYLLVRRACNRCYIHVFACFNPSARTTGAAGIPACGTFTVESLRERERELTFTDSARPGHNKALPYAAFGYCSCEQPFYSIISNKRFEWHLSLK